MTTMEHRKHTTSQAAQAGTQRATRRAPTLALSAALALFLASAPAAQARSQTDGLTQAETAAPAHKHKKNRSSGSVRIKQGKTSGSEETAAQRDRRLQRECKGLPNAGACLGYSKP